MFIIFRMWPSELADSRDNSLNQGVDASDLHSNVTPVPHIPSTLLRWQDLLKNRSGCLGRSLSRFWRHWECHKYTINGANCRSWARCELKRGGIQCKLPCASLGLCCYVDCYCQCPERRPCVSQTLLLLYSQRERERECFEGKSVLENILSHCKSLHCYSIFTKEKWTP